MKLSLPGFDAVIANARAFLETVGIGVSIPFTATGYNREMNIIVQRTKQTKDGLFGILSLDFNLFTCYTIENFVKAIPAGTYDVQFDYSNRFNRQMPHILVPVRDTAAGGDAGIRIHWGNFPTNYEGCIGVGDAEEPDAIDNTVATFNQLYKIISPISAGLKIQVHDIKELIS